MKRPTIAQFIATARADYADPSGDNVEIDDNPEASVAEYGCWVAAWVFVRDEDISGDFEGGNVS